MTASPHRTLMALALAATLALAAAPAPASAGGRTLIAAGRYEPAAAAPIVVYEEPPRHLRFVESYNGVGPPAPCRRVPWDPDLEVHWNKIAILY
jgi:hypothetical protein